MRKLILITSFLLFFQLSNSTYAQGVYKGGKGDGYAMAELKSIALTIEASSPGYNSIIFPNPVKSGHNFQIQLSNSEIILQARISESSGLGSVYLNNCIGFSNCEISTGSLKKGIYFLQVRTSSGLYHQKIIVL